MSRQRLRISELASLVGVTTKTVRHYHKIGLLAEPERSEASYRLYDATHLVRLNRIVRLKGLGISLNQIQAIFEADDSDNALKDVLDAIHLELTEQVAHLSERLEKVNHYRTQQYRLMNIEVPDGLSKTFRYATEHLLSREDEVPNALIHDQAYMAELESIAWPPSIQKMLERRVNSVADDPDLKAYRRLYFQLFVELADVPEESAEVVNAAWQVAQTEGAKKMGQILKDRAASADLYEQIHNDTAQILASERYTPAQYRFVMVLRDMILR